jgi:hypothetical protein
LSTTCDRVCNLEGEFGSGTVAFTTLEGDGRCALAEVCSTTSGGTTSSVAVTLVGIASVAVVGVSSIAVVLVCVSSVAVVLVCVSSVAVVLVCVSSVAVVLVVVGVTIVGVTVVGVTIVGVTVVGVTIVGVTVVGVTVVGVAIVGVTVVGVTVVGVTVVGVSSIAVVLVGIAGVALVRISSIAVVLVGIACVTSITASRSTTSRSLGNNEVTETSLVKEVENTQAISIEGSALSLLAKRGNSAVNIDIRVDERSDTTELGSSGKRWVTTDVLDVAVGERVSVLLSSNKSDGSSNSICASTKLGDDLVSTAKLLYCQYSVVMRRSIEISPWHKSWLHPKGR